MSGLGCSELAERLLNAPEFVSSREFPRFHICPTIQIVEASGTEELFQGGESPRGSCTVAVGAEILQCPSRKPTPVTTLPWLSPA